MSSVKIPTAATCNSPNCCKNKWGCLDPQFNIKTDLDLYLDYASKLKIESIRLPRSWIFSDLNHFNHLLKIKKKGFKVIVQAFADDVFQKKDFFSFIVRGYEIKIELLVDEALSQNQCADLFKFRSSWIDSALLDVSAPDISSSLISFLQSQLGSDKVRRSLGSEFNEDLFWSKILLKARYKKVSPDENAELYFKAGQGVFDLIPLKNSLLAGSEALTPKLSIVIPLHNKEQLIKKVLSALNNQLATSPNFEVILVNDESSDRSLELALNFFLSQNLIFDYKVFHWPKSNPDLYRAGQCRNLGLANARAEIVAFIDADVIVPDNFVTACLEAHQENDVVQYKKVELSDSCHFEKKYWKAFSSIKDWMSLKSPWLYFSSCACSVKKSFLQAAGGFKYSFTSYGLEDTALGYNLLKITKSWRLHDLAVVHHNTSPRANGFLGKVKKLRQMKKSAQVFSSVAGSEDFYKLFYSLLGSNPALRWFLKAFCAFYPTRVLALAFFYFIPVLRALLEPVALCNKLFWLTFESLHEIKANAWKSKLPYYRFFELLGEIKSNLWKLKSPLYISKRHWGQVTSHFWKVKLPYYRSREFWGNLVANFWKVKLPYYRSREFWGNLVANFWKVKLPYYRSREFWGNLVANFWKVKLPFYRISSQLWKLKLPFYRLKNSFDRALSNVWKAKLPFYRSRELWGNLVANFWKVKLPYYRSREFWGNLVANFWKVKLPYYRSREFWGNLVANFWKVKLPYYRSREFWGNLVANFWKVKIPYYRSREFWGNLVANFWKVKLPYYRSREFWGNLVANFWKVKLPYYRSREFWGNLVANFWKVKLPYYRSREFWGNLVANFWKVKLPFYRCQVILGRFVSVTWKAKLPIYKGREFWRNLAANFWKVKLPFYRCQVILGRFVSVTWKAKLPYYKIRQAIGEFTSNFWKIKLLYYKISSVYGLVTPHFWRIKLPWYGYQYARFFLKTEFPLVFLVLFRPLEKAFYFSQFQFLSMIRSLKRRTSPTEM